MRQAVCFRLVALGCFLLVWCGCVKQIGVMPTRLYNIETGEMSELNVHYSGTDKGSIDGSLRSGEIMTGEWVVVRNDTVAWGSIYSSVYTPAGASSGSASGVAVARGGTQYGTGLAKGDKGTILDCEFLVGTNRHGTGACKDNHGTKYKMMF
ncbi:MAG: hypothetical protein ACLPOO_09950 [Terriglobales bacterium]